MNSFPCSILYSRAKGCRSVIINSHLFLKIKCVCVVLQLLPEALSVTPLDPVSLNKWINGIFPVRIPIGAMYWCCAILNITHNYWTASCFINVKGKATLIFLVVWFGFNGKHEALRSQQCNSVV